MRTKSNQETKWSSWRVLIFNLPKSTITCCRKEGLQRNVAKWLTSAIPSVNSVVTALVLVHLQAPLLPGPTLLELLPHPPFPCKKHQPPDWFSGAAPAPASLVSHVDTTSQGRGPGAAAQSHGTAGQRQAGQSGAGRTPCTDQAGAQ